MKKEKISQRLESLRAKHRTLDEDIIENEKHRIDVSNMKSEKLKIKEEITKLEREL